MLNFQHLVFGFCMHLQIHGHGAFQIHPALDSQLARSPAPSLILCTDFLAVVDIIIVEKVVCVGKP
jgi:hypothetical protein